VLFDATSYGKEVCALLAIDGRGWRLMPLAGGQCSSTEALKQLNGAQAARLFPGSRSPQGALSGLYLYFSCLDECHSLAQDINTPEGSFWHGIMHRQEPDAGNAQYWFQRVGAHPVFPALNSAAHEIVHAHPETGVELPAAWDPFRFIDLCESARRQPGSLLEEVAMQIQRAEWQLLFDYCGQRA
jgi:hypothetical protein